MMNLARAAFASTALFLCSCATDWQAAEKTPDRPELIGAYDIQGDGLGVCMSITLEANGNYNAINCGGVHRGDSSSGTHGLWQLERNHIFFYDVHGKYDASAYLNYAEVFYFKGTPAFVLARHLNQGKAHEWFVFTKQPGDDA